MKKLFTGFLFLNFLLEIVAGVALIGATLGLLSVPQLETSMWTMIYGFAALSVATAIFWIWPHRDSRAAVGAVLGILFSFHALLFIAFVIEGNQVPPTIAHGVMAALAIYLYMQRPKWCAE